MRSKLRKFYLQLSGSVTFLLLSAMGHAQMTVTPVNGGSISAAYQEAVAPGTTGTYVFYYYVGTSLKSPSFLAADTSTLDITKTAATDSGLKNQIQLKIASNLPLRTNQMYAVTFLGMPNTSANPHPAPIASVNGVACSTSNNQCVAYNQINPSFNHYYGAIYSGTGLTIGFYLNDICRDAQIPAGDLTGCSGGSIIAAAAGSPAKIQLQFSIVPIANNAQLTVPSGTELDKMTTALTLAFQSDSPTFTCPSESVLGAMYFPGDSNIQFLPINQAAGNAGLLNLTTTSGQAPAQSVVVVGNDGALPDVSSSYASNNTIHQEVPLSVVSNITGFSNSTSKLEHPYQLSLIMRDSTGVYIPPSEGAAACTIKPVYSAALGGLLTSNNCFIATATFQDGSALPVELFRRFRDQVLLEHPWGVAFVRWYYSWSPEGADWLREHRFFQFSSLYFLFPLQLIAGFTLYPGFVGLLVLFLCFTWSVAWMGRSRKGL